MALAYDKNPPVRIRVYISLMAAAIVLPLSLAGGIALDKIVDGERKAALRGLTETVRATSLAIDKEVQASLTGLRVLGNSAHLETGDLKAFYDQAVNLDQKPNVWTVLFDDKGRLLLNTVVPYGQTRPTVVAPEPVTQVISTQRPVVTGLVTGAVTQKLLTGVYAPAKAKGGSAFVVGQAYTVDHWANTALHSKLPEGWVVGVIDPSGRFISRSVRSHELLGQQARPELVAAAAASHDGILRHKTLDGVESYDAFNHSDLTGWTVAVAAPVSIIDGAKNGATQIALVGMLAALGLAVIAAASFGRRFVNAVESSSLAAVSLGRGAIPKIAPTSIDEVDVLNRHLTDAAALIDREKRSREAAEVERERLLELANAARVTAQQENVAKDQFLAMLGHELRNPLAAIAGAASVLERTGVSEAHARFLHIIQRQNQHLVRIVNDLLDVSRLIAGKMQLDRRELDLGECVASCVEAVKLTEQGARFNISLAIVSCWVNGDAVRLEQVVNSLITNALKFSPAGTEIKVSVRKEEPYAFVTVVDEGKGIEPELREFLFDPFFQGPTTAEYMQSGLGIGLALVKQLVDLHGGGIEVASLGKNKGSTFMFWMPLVQSVPRVT